MVTFRLIFGLMPRARLLCVIAGVLICLCAFAAATDEISTLKERISQLQEESKWVEAMPLAETLVSTTARVHGEKSSEMADALHRWAWLVQQNGDYDTAEELWLQALAIDEGLYGKGSLQTTRRLHLLGNLYRDRGDYRRALPLLERALSIRQRFLGTNHFDTAQVLHSLGRLLSLQGDLGNAEVKLFRACGIFEKAGAEGRQQLAGCLSTLGWLYLGMGDYEQAEQMVHRSLKVRRMMPGLENDALVGSFRELGLIHSARGQYDKAESFYAQSLAVREKLFGMNHLLVAESLEDLGATYLARDDVINAERTLAPALEIREKNLGADHPQVASALVVLSRVHERKGDYRMARDLCERAHRIRQKHFGALHHLTVSALRQLACLDAALGHPERALAAADIIQEGEEAVLAGILSFTSERQRLACQQDNFEFKGCYDLWADLGATKPLARTILRTKGLVLDSLLEDSLFARASSDPRVSELVERIANCRRRLAQFAFVTGRRLATTDTNSERQVLSDQIQSLESVLARQVAGRLAGTLAQPGRRALSVKAEQVESALPEGTVLLEMLRYRHYVGRGHWADNYGTLILSRREEPRWVPLGPAADIDSAIHLYQHAVRNPTEELSDLLHKLYEQIGAPLICALPPDTERIIISPDGELNFVSFATLLTPAGRFLGEEYWCSYVSCGRDLLIESKTNSVAGQLLVWANPDYDAAPGRSRIVADSSPMPSRELRNLSLRPLPGAEKEGRLLCKGAQALGFEKAVLRVGSQAAEAELQSIHSPKALHLATHAFLLPQLEPSDNSSESFERHYPLPTLNPMLRSGLALAGAQRTFQLWSEGKSTIPEDDGILTAQEIGEMDLQGTWLVVLSACDTAGGEARAGEGVLGLRRGFVQAGAQNLLMTLWPIDDEQTFGFVLEFYARAQKTGCPSQALAEAQRIWLQRLRLSKGVADACRLAGPFILSFQGKPPGTGS